MTYPYNAIPSNNPQNITVSTPVGCERNPRDPNAQDDTFPPSWEWQNTVSGAFFKCQSSTIAGAVWVPFAGVSTGTVVSLTGNTGGAVNPDGMGNISVVGDGTTIDIVGNPGTNTLTASLIGGGVAAQTFTTNVGGPVSPTAAGVLNLNASTSTYTNGATANTVKIEMQGTDHALFIGNGANTPASTLAVGTNGQVLIAATTADPAFATLTSSGGTIVYTPGANSLNLEVSSSFFKTINIQTFSSNGTYTPTAGMVYCIVECVGGGGGGGGSSNAGVNSGNAGGGGGSGAYSRSFFAAASIGASQTVTIGAGGTAGSNLGGNGGSGGTTSLGILITAPGGTGGGGSTGAGDQGGSGGIVGTGQVALVGTGGDAGTVSISAGVASVSGGSGAPSFFGGGARASAASTSSNGLDGANGGGGSGACSYNAGGAATGGVGGDGFMVITEYL